MCWAGVASVSQGHNPVVNENLWLLFCTLLLYVLIYLSLTVLLNSFGPDETWRTLNFQSSHHQMEEMLSVVPISPRGRHPELTDVQVPDLPGSLECSKPWPFPYRFLCKGHSTSFPAESRTTPCIRAMTSQVSSEWQQHIWHFVDKSQQWQYRLFHNKSYNDVSLQLGGNFFHWGTLWNIILFSFF